MGAEQGTIPGQAPGQAPANVPQGQEQVQGKTPVFVTQEEALQIAKQAAAEATRTLQSQFDKGTNTIFNKVQAELAQMKSLIALQRQAGMQIPPEQEQAIQNQIIASAFNAPPEPPPPSSGQPAQAAQPGAEDDGKPSNEWEATAYALMEEAGIVIEPTDPEAASLDTKDGYHWVRSIERAIEAKRARLAASPSPQQQPTQPQPTQPQPARTPTNLGGYGGNVNPIANINDPTELLEMALGTRR